MKNVTTTKITTTIEDALFIGEHIRANGRNSHSAIVGEIVKITEKSIFIHYRIDIVYPGVNFLAEEYCYQVWVPKSVLEIKPLKCEGHYTIHIKDWFVKKSWNATKIRKAK